MEMTEEWRRGAGAVRGENQRQGAQDICGVANPKLWQHCSCTSVQDKQSKKNEARDMRCARLTSLFPSGSL